MLAVDLNISVHGLHQAANDAHAQTGALNAAGRAAFRSLERLKYPGEKFRRHADTVILTPKEQRATPIFGFLRKAAFNPPAGGGVFDCVADNIDIYLAKTKRVANQNLLLDFFSGQAPAMMLLIHLGPDDNLQIMKQITDGKRCRCQLHTAGINAGHIQHIVDQTQQMGSGSINFAQSVQYPRFFIDMFTSQSGHADDSVHGGADIMGHAAEEGLLGSIGGTGFRQFPFQRFNLMPQHSFCCFRIARILCIHGISPL